MRRQARGSVLGPVRAMEIIVIISAVIIINFIIIVVIVVITFTIVIILLLSRYEKYRFIVMICI